VRSDGKTEQVSAAGLPFGLLEDADYDEEQFTCQSGDSLLMFTDGAVEICDPDGRLLGSEGLIGILSAQGYPKSGIRMAVLQEALLTFSNGISLDDDLTLLEVRFS